MRVEDLARIDTELLDRLGVASAGHYLGELERIQLAQRGQGTTRYVVARDGSGRPLGMLPVYTSDPPWHPVADPVTLFGLPAAAIGPRLCLAGSYGTYANFLTVAASVTADAAETVALTLVDRARAVAREAGSAYVVLPYLDETQARWLAGRDVAAVHTREKAALPVVWDSFDAYVASLPARRRTGVRRERRRFLDSAFEVREERVVDAAPRLAPLLAQTERRYGREADPRQMAFHYTLLGTYLADDDFVALVAYREQRPVACSLLLTSGTRLISKAWGCDYAAAGDNFLYFNLTFYEPIIRAIARGVEVLDFGLGSLESKAQRGCGMERLQTVLIAAEG